MQPSSRSDLIRRLRELGPFVDDQAAASALTATLEALAELLLPEERRALDADLPDFAAAIMRKASPALGYGGLPENVARHEGVARGLAREHAELVCRALGETLSPTALARLGRALPQIADWFAPPVSQFDAPLPYPSGPTLRHDLAAGHAGGARPLASADPNVLAHRHSVARSTDPHADTKLSSARGLTQEREARSLATGRQGSKRPLSEDH